MKPWDPITFFKALGDETRLRCLMLLMAERELCVCELGHALGVVQPKISRHLATMRSAGLVLDRRQGTWIHYRIHPDLPAWMQSVLENIAHGLRGDFGFLQDADALKAMQDRPDRCHPPGLPLLDDPSAPLSAADAGGALASGILPGSADPGLDEDSGPEVDPLPGEGVRLPGGGGGRVLFLSVRNGAPGLMAEALFNHLGGGRCRAESAGLRAGGAVHPGVVELLQALGIATEGLSVKGCDALADGGAPSSGGFDSLVVLDGVAEWPVWLREVPAVRWRIPDPEDEETFGSGAGTMAAFQQVLRLLMPRIRQLVATFV